MACAFYFSWTLGFCKWCCDLVSSECLCERPLSWAFLYFIFNICFPFRIDNRGTAQYCVRM